MQRIESDDGLFIGGNPATNTKGTVVTDSWLNTVQEELAGIVENSGGVLSTSDNAQVSKAIQTSKIISATAGGSADAITASFMPAIMGLVSGLSLHVRAVSANTIPSPTFTPNVGTVAAKPIVKGSNSSLVAGDIAGSGHWLVLRYDETLDKWVLQNPATGAATVTSANDGAYINNSDKPASTSWVRGAMSAIAIASGFAISSGANGYIKFPSWLGGIIVQWGKVTNSPTPGGGTPVTFPLQFPTVCRVLVTGNETTSTTGATSAGTIITTTGFNASSGVANLTAPWIAIGY